MITIDKVMQAQKEVVDPEIGLNVVDLNMIKKVNIDDKKKVKVTTEGRDVDVVMLDEPWIPPGRFRR